MGVNALKSGWLKDGEVDGDTTLSLENEIVGDSPINWRLIGVRNLENSLGFLNIGPLEIPIAGYDLLIWDVSGSSFTRIRGKIKYWLYSGSDLGTLQNWIKGGWAKMWSQATYDWANASDSW